MTKKVQKRIRQLVTKDKESESIAWDKGTPEYEVLCEAKHFYVRNLKTWCDFYEVSYQMLLRNLRDGDGKYKGVEVVKL